MRSRSQSGAVFAVDFEDPLEQPLETPALAPELSARHKEPPRVGSALLPALQVVLQPDPDQKSAEARLIDEQGCTIRHSAGCFSRRVRYAMPHPLNGFHLSAARRNISAMCSTYCVRVSVSIMAGLPLAVPRRSARTRRDARSWSDRWRRP